MTDDTRKLVEAIHGSPGRLVVALSGGGAQALAELLEVPGASRTLLEAVVPYCEAAITRWLGGRPDQFCAPRTARAMAMVAFHRARELGEEPDFAAGMGCTASLATDRPKRGEHRAHVGLQTAGRTSCWSITLEKGRRSRQEEEGLVSRLVLRAVAVAVGLVPIRKGVRPLKPRGSDPFSDTLLETRPPLDLAEHEKVDTSDVVAEPAWKDLLLGTVDVVRRGENTSAVFPGMFNPLHVGHRRMMEVAREMLGMPIALEISIENVDKPPLDYYEIDRRLGQFAEDQPVWLSRAATFLEKSRLFPGSTFLVGTDTLRRIADPRYYGDDAACRAAVEKIAQRGCRFLVFGRNLGTGFMRLGDLDLPERLRAICREIPAERFREDVSSTGLRRAGEW